MIKNNKAYMGGHDRNDIIIDYRGLFNICLFKL